MNRIQVKRLVACSAAAIAGIPICGAFVFAQNWTNEVFLETADGYHYITSNGIPDHAPGQFPNARNPNAIAPQIHRYRVPANPKKAKDPTPVGMMPFGVALNGVPFNPGAAEWWNGDPRSGWQFEAMTGFTDLGMDQHNAHVQPGGVYHYHGYPNGLADRLYHGEDMTLLGFAADGFPIYAPYAYRDPNDPSRGTKKMRSSYRLKRARREGGPGGRHDGTFVEDFEYLKNFGDLDECNGREGVTPEYPDGIYHYFITETFPFIPRYLRGTPDDSFKRRGPPPGQGGRGPEGLGGHHPPHHPPPPHGAPPPPPPRQ